MCHAVNTYDVTSVHDVIWEKYTPCGECMMSQIHMTLQVYDVTNTHECMMSQVHMMS